MEHPSIHEYLTSSGFAVSIPKITENIAAAIKIFSVKSFKADKNNSKKSFFFTSNNNLKFIISYKMGK